MLSSSKGRVLKDISVRRAPVEIQLRRDFIPPEPEEEERFQDDPQVVAARQEAERIIQKAVREGEEIIKKAQAEREAFVEAARREGFARGYQEGYDQGLQEANLIKEQAENLLVEARKAYRAVMVQAEPNLLELSILIAEKIIKRQVALAPDTVKTLAAELLKEVHAGETFFLYVHPSEAKLLEEARQELVEAAPAGVALHIIPDKSITPGGCRLETDTGYYDATIEGQLLELKKMLQDGGAHG